MNDKGIKYASFTQISPERDISSNAFSKGQINFRVNQSSMSRWNPSRSYLRMRIKITDVADNALTTRNGIGPSYNQGQAFFQQACVSCKGVRISEIDDYYVQIAALKERTRHDSSRRDGLYYDTNFTKSNIKSRIAAVSKYGFQDNEPDWIPFTNLYQADGTTVQNDDEAKVDAGDLTLLEYRSNGDGAGTIDLLESQLDVGDHILITSEGNVNEVRRIIELEDDTMHLDQALVAFAAADLVRDADTGVNLLYYTKSKPSRRLKEYEIVFKPALAFFDLDEYLPGNYEITLTPHSALRFERYAIESLIDKVPGVDYKLEVIDLQFYAWKGHASSPISRVSNYGFSETRCQAQTITSASMLNKCFVVNQNAHMFTIAYQKADAGNNTAYSLCKFKMVNDYEKKIGRYQLRLNGETLPTPLPQIRTNPNANIDFATQQYWESLVYNQSIAFDSPESLSEWFSMGPYYSYILPKKLNALANRLYVSQEFNEASPENFLLLVFDTFYTGFSIECDNGLITKCTRDVMKN